MRRSGIIRVALLPASVALAGCGATRSPEPPGPTVTPTPTLFTCSVPAPLGFRIVGYMPAWQGSVDDIALAKLTHVNYAFALPTPDGGLRPVQAVTWSPKASRSREGRLPRSLLAEVVQKLRNVGEL